jgi:hypothetical protein
VLIHEVMAGQEDIKEVSEDIKALENRVSARCDGIESRLGKIENLLQIQKPRISPHAFSFFNASPCLLNDCICSWPVGGPLS